VTGSGRLQQGAWAALTLILLGTPSHAANLGPDSRADSLRFHAEIGAAVDISTEQFYEDVFDSLLAARRLGRRLIGSPETNTSSVAALSAVGTRAEGASRYALRGEWAEGSRLRRGALNAEWSQSLGSDWRLALAPQTEYRHDRTFGRDVEEWRTAAAGRAKRRFGDGDRMLSLAGFVEQLRTWGDDVGYLLDRDAGTGSIAFERSGTSGADWQLGYSLTGRSYPDSSAHDHLEHGWEARWRRDYSSAALLLETEGIRRVARSAAPTSRDDFTDERGAVEVNWSMPRVGVWSARLEAEGFQYDREDTTLFFDTRVFRARIGPRLQSASVWSLSLGPRAEWLRSPRDPGEQYREVAAQFELEWWGGHGWWSVTPAVGWRAYDDASSGVNFATPGMHSSYAFYELEWFGDQPLPAGLRLRALGTGRLERHEVDAEDARSLYFSLDVRRLF
jgi:hypothetical protein